MPKLRRGSADRARPNLGPGYHKLWSAAAISTLGDGVFLAALPLLAATLSRDPLRVSLVTFAGWLPWLLFGLVSGALVDRWDRRRMMWSVDAVRFALLAAIRGHFAPQRPAGPTRASLRADIAEGLGWLRGHRLLRALAVMVG